MIHISYKFQIFCNLALWNMIICYACLLKILVLPKIKGFNILITDIIQEYLVIHVYNLLIQTPIFFLLLSHKIS